jgi:hypothetical protein
VNSSRSIAEASAPFISLFRERHPDHNGMVGSERFGQLNLGHDDTYLTRSALGELWERHRTFDVPAEAVDTLADELEDFIDRPAIRLQFQALLLNFRMSGDRLELPAELVVRRLTEEEVTGFYGGPVESPGLYRTHFGLHEFAVEGHTEEKMPIGQRPTFEVFSRNSDPSRMYRRMTASDLYPHRS